MIAKRTVTWAVIAALFAVVGIWLWLRLTIASVAKLPSGGQVRLCALTSGPRHEFVYGPISAKWIARIFPESWAKKLGVRVVRHTSSPDAIVVWLEWQTPKGAPPPGEYISVVDERGLEGEPLHAEIR